jgi:hypothetical protein
MFVHILTHQIQELLEHTLLKPKQLKKLLESMSKLLEPMPSHWPLTTVQTQKVMEEKWPYSTSIVPLQVLQELLFTHITEKMHQLLGKDTNQDNL